MPRPASLNAGTRISAYALGIDLGGTSVKAVAVTPKGRTLARTNVGFNAETKTEWAEQRRRILQHLQGDIGRGPAGGGQGLSKRDSAHAWRRGGRRRHGR